MEVEWHVTEADVTRVKKLIDQQADNPLVRSRREKNCATTKRQVDERRFWQQMVSMRLTTQQKSGPKGSVARLARENPFPLSYDATCAAGSVEPFIAQTLRKWGGIRMVDKIAKELTWNFELLQNGEWGPALAHCNRLTVPVSRAIEVEVAEYIQKFAGFGPKQSRNLLQALGLTRYEIPIDSRVIDWLNRFGFPIRLSATALSDVNYYSFISDGIQVLCMRCSVLPCILDAAIFALKDANDWTEDNVF
jgi:hypothetical protein